VAGPVTETEVLIVGAGAAGLHMAAVLGEAGRCVHVIEAGPAWQLQDLVSSQLYSRRLRAGPVDTGGPQPVGAGFNLGRGVGGAALHHYATWPRLKEADFRLRTLYGEGLDWPLDYATLRPFYDRVQREVGIAGDSGAEVWRPPADPYPMPPHPLNAQSRVLKRGFDKLGLRLAPAPMAITSMEYKGRPPCIYDGWCDAGCPIGALANPQTVWLPRCEAAGVTVEAEVPALRIAAGPGGRIEGVVVGGREPRFIGAKLVVLAASVPHNPALLLASRLGGPMVGRYLMTHSLIQVVGLFDEPTAPHEGLVGAMLIGHDGYRKDAEPGFLGGHQWLVAPAMKPNDLAGLVSARAELFGPELAAFAARMARGGANMIGMGEALPDADNRVTLAVAPAPGEPPRPQLTHKHRPGAQRAWERMRDEGRRVMKAAGALESWHSPQGSAHLMGGTVMGRTPEDSVCDAYGQVHGHPNLFVAGPGLFPTGGAANPTFTVHALTLRAGEHIAREWRGLVA
jgi:choline dehydrogenase-like flavoprotein